MEHEKNPFYRNSDAGAVGKCIGYGSANGYHRAEPERQPNVHQNLYGFWGDKPANPSRGAFRL